MSEISDMKANCRIVDGVSSTQTYVVLATSGDMRLAVRFLQVTNCHDYNRSGEVKENPKSCLGTYWKVHVEKDSEREDLGGRHFDYFGMPSDKFAYKYNRYTGILVVPFAYLPNTAERLKSDWVDSDTHNKLWEVLMEPVQESGALPRITKRTFGVWVNVQLGDDPFGISPYEEQTEGRPVSKAFWLSI